MSVGNLIEILLAVLSVSLLYRGIRTSTQDESGNRGKAVLPIIGGIVVLAILAFFLAGCSKSVPKEQMKQLCAGKWSEALDAAGTIALSGQSSVPDLKRALAHSDPVSRWAAAAGLCIIG